MQERPEGMGRKGEQASERCRAVRTPDHHRNGSTENMSSPQGAHDAASSVEAWAALRTPISNTSARICACMHGGTRARKASMLASAKASGHADAQAQCHTGGCWRRDASDVPIGIQEFRTCPILCGTEGLLVFKAVWARAPCLLTPGSNVVLSIGGWHKWTCKAHTRVSCPHSRGLPAHSPETAFVVPHTPLFGA
eukprot:12415467-Alexandrium_andersonii.AAC.1